MLRGFFATEWMNLTPLFQPHQQKPYDHNFLFPKLIADLWKHQIDFWKQYQQDRHSSVETTIRALSQVHSKRQAQIRHLFTLADKVLQSQRSHLFPSDLELFLTTNSTTQLTTYIELYTPAIRLSIRQARHRATRNTRSLHTDGFSTHTAASLPVTTTTTTPLLPQATPHPHIINLPQPLQPPTPPRPRLHQRIITWARTHLSNPPLTPQLSLLPTIPPLRPPSATATNPRQPEHPITSIHVGATLICRDNGF